MTSIELLNTSFRMDELPTGGIDSQWNDATATMRPAEGTYSGETWRNFPYTKDYLYVSGGNE
jgi:hypothetical protein